MLMAIPGGNGFPKILCKMRVRGQSPLFEVHPFLPGEPQASVPLRKVMIRAVRTLSCQPLPQPKCACFDTSCAESRTLLHFMETYFRGSSWLYLLENRGEHGLQAHTLPASLNILRTCYWNGTFCFIVLYSFSIVPFFLALINLLSMWETWQQKMKLKRIFSDTDFQYLTAWEMWKTAGIDPNYGRKHQTRAENYLTNWRLGGVRWKVW